MTRHPLAHGVCDRCDCEDVLIGGLCNVCWMAPAGTPTREDMISALAMALQPAMSLREDDWCRDVLQKAREARDSDGTASAAVCEDIPVPKDCQARAESIAPNPPATPERKVHDQQ